MKRLELTESATVYYPNPTEEYSIKCPYCGHELISHASILHLKGQFNKGKGKCTNCFEIMGIKYNQSNNSMSTYKRSLL